MSKRISCLLYGITQAFPIRECSLLACQVSFFPLSSLWVMPSFANTLHLKANWTAISFLILREYSGNCGGLGYREPRKHMNNVVSHMHLFHIYMVTNNNVSLLSLQTIFLINPNNSVRHWVRLMHAHGSACYCLRLCFLSSHMRDRKWKPSLLCHLSACKHCGRNPNEN